WAASPRIDCIDCNAIAGYSLRASTMASITIRQLDDKLKQRLRLRAARHGRSMEDEARTILREAAALEDDGMQASVPGREATRGRRATTEPARAPKIAPAADVRQILLI